jgi:hypothetical protein
VNACALSPLDIQDVEEDIRRIEELLDCGIFQRRNYGNPLFRSAFIEAVILVRDLLAKLKKAGVPLTWTDSVLPNEYVSNITELVTTMRDAACHSDSFKRHLDQHQNRASFVVIAGRGAGMQLGDLRLGCEFEDDVAFFYGKNRLYLRRGLIRAYKEACIALAPLFSQDFRAEWIRSIIDKRTLPSKTPAQPPPAPIIPAASQQPPALPDSPLI